MQRGDFYLGEFCGQLSVKFVELFNESSVNMMVCLFYFLT